jgi:flagellar assembly factor FliW
MPNSPDREVAAPMPALTDHPPVPAALTFEAGLVGLPQLRRFEVKPLGETPFLLLDSLDDETFGVVAAVGDQVRPGYTAELVAAASAVEGEVVLVILSVHGDPPSMTANLAGPIVLDPATGSARQTVIEDDAYPLRASIWEAE